MLPSVGRPDEGRRTGRFVWTLLSVTVAIGGLATLVTVLPFVSFAHKSPTLHVAIETSVSIIGLLAAYLVLGRFRRSEALDDLLLVGALVLLALTNLCFSALPALEGGPSGRFETWSPVIGRVFGAIGVAVAAFSPSKRLHSRRRALAIMLGGCAVGLVAIAAVIAGVRGVLPSGLDPDLSPVGSERPRIVGHPALLSIQALGALLFAAAATGFARRALRRRDELMAWLAGASVLAAFARLNYFLFPSLYSDWVYTGDFLRLGSYLLLLAGALREIGAYQRQAEIAAQLMERHRIARDLHDGLAQDLAFITMQVQELADKAGRDGEARANGITRLSQAAHRALAESRHAITMLVGSPDEPLAVAVERVAEETSSRRGARVTVDIEPGIEVPAEVQHALARIVAEAITNATRHGRARAIEVSLASLEDGLQLRISDDGCGVDRPRPGGFGLSSMRSRVSDLGGTFNLRSTVGEGTTVTVVLPLRGARAV